ncbi:M16 family metallopeptidase [Pseudomonas sp. NPDC090592]|uniref:M16 family metallopeptidase n=1 Tax=Pseudomonas sp. NPDC090592 TaxID=3364480 RepID=UPI00383BB702
MPLPHPSLLDLEQVNAGLASIVAAAPPQLQHFQLDNGLSVYLRENHRTQLAAVQLWYHVGSSHEPAGHSNLSHLLEHLIFEGSSKLAAGEYSRVIARIAGNANASTLADATSYEMSLPASRLPIALEVMADAMNNATFGQTEMARGVKAVKDERRLNYESQPVSQAYDQHSALAHGSSPYSNPAYGSPADLDNITLERLRDWYRSWYRPNNATLVVVGNIDLAMLRQQVERYFSDLPRWPIPDSPTPRHPASLQERSHTVRMPGLHDGLVMSFNVPGIATAPDPTTASTLTLLAEVLGGGFSAMLYSDLVRDKRMLTSVAVTYDVLMRGDTLLTISGYVNTSNATPEQAAEAIYQQVNALRTTLLAEDHLQQAKLRMLARHLFNMDDLNSLTAQIGAVAAAGLPAGVIDQSTSIVLNLDSAQVRQVALTYLGRERLTTTYLRSGAPA